MITEELFKAIAEKTKNKKLPFFPGYIIMGCAVLLMLSESYIGVHLVMLGLLYLFVMYSYNDYLEGLKGRANSLAFAGIFTIGLWIFFIVAGVLPIYDATKSKLTDGSWIFAKGGPTYFREFHFYDDNTCTVNNILPCKWKIFKNEKIKIDLQLPNQKVSCNGKLEKGSLIINYANLLSVYENIIWDDEKSLDRKN